ncbi:hypothetical protein CFC21_007782 [Triticum aestivum]|uniref:DUF6598 domain-containing protein n=3 Tax=Triticum TaxID=4564 RepID=A0A9R0R1M2_TRITD|nr:uncharacterized protein LOC123094047 [Triticum aestivum]KAF6990615.1 hypothetical protein CFC21_007782 [Triticum aestivum]VAH20230.1 unnamed protein product [Triticum turgidum subsp. durum]
MEACSETTEEAGTEMARGSRRTSRKMTKTEYPSVLDAMDAAMNQVLEEQMEGLVARWNAENPDATPLVVEALTEEQRESLEREHLAREVLIGQAYVDKMAAEDMARLELEKTKPKKDPDERSYQYYRENWEWKYAEEFGSFEATTRIPAMCFTDKPTKPGVTNPERSMQIFSVKVEEIYGDLHWPLDVFGIVAVRDDLDHRRNIIFERKRDNCQTLNEEDPYLVLTGPTRAPLTLFGPMHFDITLKVKRSNELEDKDLSLLGFRYECCKSINYQASKGEHALRSCVSSQKHRSKLSTLELTCGIVVSSIEATISVRIVGGSWPDGFSGLFIASTASVSHMRVLLLNIGDKDTPVVAADGTIELSRRVVSVESFGELRVHAAGWLGSQQVDREVFFQPLESGRSSRSLKVGSCEMEVTVGWCLFPLCYPTDGIPSPKNG